MLPNVSMIAIGYPTIYCASHAHLHLLGGRLAETNALLFDVIGIGCKVCRRTILDLRHGMLFFLITDTVRHRLGIRRYTLGLAGLLVGFILKS